MDPDDDDSGRVGREWESVSVRSKIVKRRLSFVIIFLNSVVHEEKRNVFFFFLVNNKCLFIEKRF